MTRPVPGGTPIGVVVRAHVRDFTPLDIETSQQQQQVMEIGDSKVIISTTQIDAANWPGNGDSKMPRKGDRLTISGRGRTLLYAYPAPHLQGELVRINIVVR